MKKYEISSSFQSLPIEIFYYPAKKKSKHTILLLKGLYGFHNPKSLNSWENEIIQSSRGKYNFVCINTARKDIKLKESYSQKAFSQKSFKQECDDIYRVYKYLVDKKVLLKNHKLSVIGNSFGGTSLLGIPKLINRSSLIIMIGSGCGKSLTTTKPLLKTLFDEKKLLESITGYKGVFVFVRGSEDKLVPKKSQDKIIKKVNSALIKINYIIQGASHNLSNSSDQLIINRKKILKSILDNAVSFIK